MVNISEYHYSCKSRGAGWSGIYICGFFNEMVQHGFLKLICSLAQVLERHYYKIHRHPGISIFTVPLTELLAYLRESSIEPATPISGTMNFKRSLQADKTIGIDYKQLPTNRITVQADPGDTIITAFPRCYQNW